MDRRQFISYCGLFVATIGGCLNRESTETAETPANQTDQGNDRGLNETGDDQGLNETGDDQVQNETRDHQEQNTTIQQSDQHIVLRNLDDETHSIRVTVSEADDDFFELATIVAPDEREQFALNIDEPGTYEVTATVNENATETWPMSFDKYDLEAGSDVIIEINDGRPDIKQQE